MLNTVVSPSSRPRMAPHVRLTVDRVRGRYVLLSPESVSVLNPCGAAVLELCDGRPVSAILGRLRDRYRAVVDGDVLRFLERLAARKYVEMVDGTDR